jgi:hypothetical protein
VVRVVACAYGRVLRQQAGHTFVPKFGHRGVRRGNATEESVEVCPRKVHAVLGMLLNESGKYGILNGIESCSWANNTLDKDILSFVHRYYVVNSSYLHD